MRKNPKQDRAAKTVDFICEAVIQLLDTPAEPDFTTNHIAERAGVSVGTLYRYFPDKGALLRFVVRREAERASAIALQVIDSSDAENTQTLLGEVVDASMGHFNQRPKAAHTIRHLAQNDPVLMDEVLAARLSVLRRLNARLVEIDPSMGPPLPDATLKATNDAFQAAIAALAAQDAERTVDKATRLRLIEALLTAFSANGGS